MNFQRLREKLNLQDGGEFASLSSAPDLPYKLHIHEGDDPHFTFESKSLDCKYYTDSDAEMLVAIRDTIREMDSLSRTLTDNDKMYRWSGGPVVIVATKMGDKSYTVVRDNKMVGSKTELSRLQNKSHVMRKIGLHPTTDIDVDRPEDALYVFLANFETARLDRYDVKESLNWSYKIVSQFEGKPLKLPMKLDGKQSGMLARPVRVFYDGEEKEGVLMNLRMGVNADVLIDDVGVRAINKKDIWI